MIHKILDSIGGPNYDPDDAADSAAILLKGLFKDGKLYAAQSVTVMPLMWDKEVRGTVVEKDLGFLSDDRKEWSGSLCAVRYVVTDDQARPAQ